MVPQSKGKIFLSDERGLTDLESFRSYNTFNFGNYCHPHKHPFGALYVLNEDTLAGGCNISLQIEENSEITLLPIVGAITYYDSLNNSGTVSAGQSVVIDAPKDLILTIENPYPEDLIKFIQWWVRVPGKTSFAKPRIHSFDISTTSDRFTAIYTTQSDPSPTPFHRASIARLAGRAEAIYKAATPRNGLFAFLIQGEMEVQYRLLQAGDGLALWDLPEMEAEALSREAILLVIELPATH